MGCGMSRYGAGADHIDGCNFHPLRRRLDELRKNDRVITDDAVEMGSSSKLLLKESGGDDDDALVDSNHKSISSPRKSVSNSPTSNIVVEIEPTRMEKKENVKAVDCESTINRKDGDEREDGVDRKEGSKKEEIVAVERSDDKDSKEREEDEEEDEGRNSDYDGSLLIGSPSFREYCAINCVSEDILKNDGTSTDGELIKKVEIKKIKGDECNAESPCSDHEVCVWDASMMKSSKKGKKGRRFKKVFPMGKPMKSLFHVTTCYNPNVSSASGDDQNKLGKPIEKTV